MASRRIRIMLCDEHTLLRACLRALLSAEGDLEVVGTSRIGKDGLERLAEWRPDVVVLGLEPGSAGSIEMTRQVLDRMPRCRVLALAEHGQAALHKRRRHSGRVDICFQKQPGHRSHPHDPSPGGFRSAGWPE